MPQSQILNLIIILKLFCMKKNGMLYYFLNRIFVLLFEHDQWRIRNVMTSAHTFVCSCVLLKHCMKNSKIK